MIYNIKHIAYNLFIFFIRFKKKDLQFSLESNPSYKHPSGHERPLNHDLVSASPWFGVSGPCSASSWALEPPAAGPCWLASPQRGRKRLLSGCGSNHITAPPVQTGRGAAVSCRTLSPSAEARRTVTRCGFKAAARLAHATSSYSSAEQTAAAQRKLCFNVIRGWSSEL